MSSSRSQLRLRPERALRPVRNVVSRTGGIVLGKSPSRRNGRIVGHEAQLECNGLVLLDLSWSIFIPINIQGGKPERRPSLFETSNENGDSPA